MANLDEHLTRIEGQVSRDLLAKGYRLADISSDLAQIKAEVRRQYAGSALPAQQVNKEMTDAFITLAMAQGLRLSARLVSNTLAVRGRLNHRQAISLWLGLFHDQSSHCEGLWQMYVDYRSLATGSPLQFPEVIYAVCGDIEGEDEDELQDKIFDFWETQLGLANQALDEAGKPILQPRDIPGLIAWILATHLDERNPDVAIQELDRTLIGVHNDLRRGYHTLLYQHLEDIFAIVEGT